MTDTLSKSRAGDQKAKQPLSVVGLRKSYGEPPNEHLVLEDLTVTIEPGEVVCIVGPSGVGKTTLLRCLSGLMPPTSGTVSFGDRRITGPIAEIGLVFQDYSRSLLPWMRTRENVAFPLQGRGVGKAERNAIADDFLAQVGLPNAGKKYPWQLSGGQQQRAAIARALAYHAQILVMDEPFASVDAQTRFELEDLVLSLRRRLEVSLVVVTHDIDEAVYLADRVIVLASNPARVVDIVEVPFGKERDQITTKADPRFTEARSRILAEIRH